MLKVVISQILNMYIYHSHNNCPFEQLQNKNISHYGVGCEITAGVTEF